MNIKLKKVISTLLAIAMVAGLFCSAAVFPAYAKDDCGYNASSTMSKLAESGVNAEAGQCISISSADELVAFADYINDGGTSAGVTFYISCDIDLTDVFWVPISARAVNSFKGVFDGCGFAILNLTQNTGSNVALFGFVEGADAVIKNIGVMGSIEAEVAVAGIAANLDGGTISNSWNAVDINGTGNVGGIVGEMKGGKIENCCNYGYIQSTFNAGAIAGKVSASAVIEYSYYVYYSADKACGNVSSNSSVDVYRFASSSTEVLTEKKLTVDNKTTDNLLVLLNEWVVMQNNDFKHREWVYDTSETGTKRTDGRYPSHRYPGYIDVMDGLYTPTSTMTALYESGQNAQNGGTYSISSGEELAYLAAYVNYGHNTEGITFYLNSDILVQTSVLAAIQEQWVPIGDDKDRAFRGVFDGQGFVVTGVVITRGNHCGLFGYVDSANAVIKNLGVNGVYTCNDHVGGIIGDLCSGSIINCWFNGNITADDHLGGIVGSCDNGSIVNCCCFSEVAGNDFVGGIVGDMTPASSVRYCYYQPDSARACGDEEGTISVAITYLANTVEGEEGLDYSLERGINIGGTNTVKLLNALNRWVSALAPDDTYRSWKIDASSASVERVLGKHPTHLFPGDNSGIKSVDEPSDTINDEGNPYNVKYLETATMTELYNSGADGIVNGHYSISSGKEMDMLALYVNAGHATKNITFYLTQDVSIAIRSMGNEHDGWIPIGQDTKLTDSTTYFRYFRGVFDGCGYTVYGMFVSKNEADEAGLFGNISGATIKNLGVMGDVVAENKVGGIVGEALDSTIINCWSSVNVQAEDRVGGIVGEMTDSQIINCVSYGQMLAFGGSLTAMAGGVVGDTDGDCKLQNCYYLKMSTTVPYEKISSETVTENIAGFTYGFVGDDYVCTLDSPASVDELVTSNLLTALNAWVYAQNNGLYSAWMNSDDPIVAANAAISGHFPKLMVPVDRPGDDDGYSGDYTAACSISELYSTRSSGLRGSTYSISGLEDLEAFQKYVRDGYDTEGITFFMTRDIDMSQKYSSGTERSWDPIGNSEHPFRGIFDGQGYTIKYMYISTTTDEQGLFGHISGFSALVKNLGITGNVIGGSDIGSICGDLNFGTIANCWSSCGVEALDGDAGGIAGGCNAAKIANCTSYGLVVSVDNYGGIIGFGFDTTIENCFYLYATCQQAYGIASTVKEIGVQYFNGTSFACIMHEPVTIAGTETRNVLSALKLYVDAHPETNYCYWTVGNTEEYLLMGVEFFPVLLTASGTMGDKDYSQTLAYYNGEGYRSLVKAVNAANDNPDGGDVTLATNVLLRSTENIALDDNVRISTGDYSLDFKSEIKVHSMQQLEGYFIINKDGGRISVFDSDKNAYKLFMYAKKDANESCNSEIYGTQSLTFVSSPVKGDFPDAYNLSLHDGEYIINSSLDSGNPHKIPAGSTLTVEKGAVLNVAANSRIRTTGGNSKIINEGTVKIGNATLDLNGGQRMVGVFEDDDGVVSLPYVYRDTYTLRGWSDGVNLYPAGSKVSIPKATNLTAQWRIGETADPYPGDDAYSDMDEPLYNIPVTVIQSKGGTIAPESYKAAKGENITHHFTPDLGYYAKNVLLDGEKAELNNLHELELISISRSHSIIALYAPVTNGEYYQWRNPFDDVEYADWCYDYVRYAVSAGMFAGTTATTFSPGKSMTREMVVVVLWRLSGSPVVPDNGVIFSDVSKNSYAYDAVRWANMFGIVQGFGDGTFGYGKPVTREQLVTFLFRFAKNYAGDNISNYDTTNILGYSDALQISKGMTQAFQWGIGAGIINGTTDTTLSPKAYTTRAQVAAILSRYCNRFINEVPTVNIDNF